MRLNEEDTDFFSMGVFTCRNIFLLSNLSELQMIHHLNI